MTQTLRIKPGAEGLKVLFPQTRRALSAKGEDVQIDTYWRRRLACGDAVEVVPEAPPEKPKPRRSRGASEE